MADSEESSPLAARCMMPSTCHSYPASAGSTDATASDTRLASTAALAVPTASRAARSETPTAWARSMCERSACRASRCRPYSDAPCSYRVLNSRKALSASTRSTASDARTSGSEASGASGARRRRSAWRCLSSAAAAAAAAASPPRPPSSSSSPSRVVVVCDSLCQSVRVDRRGSEEAPCRPSASLTSKGAAESSAASFPSRALCCCCCCRCSRSRPRGVPTTLEEEEEEEEDPPALDSPPRRRRPVVHASALGAWWGLHPSRSKPLRIQRAWRTRAARLPLPQLTTADGSAELTKARTSACSACSSLSVSCFEASSASRPPLSRSRRFSSLRRWMRAAESTSSLTETSFLTIATRCANLHVEIDSSVWLASGLTLATITVLQLPPSESRSTDVSIELR